MAFIKGKQLADSAITPAKIDFTGGTFNFAQGATLQASSPSAASDVATKSYVDSASTGSAAGLDFKESVFVATTGNLTGTYSNKVFTASANGALSIDGKSPTANQRILVKNQTTASQNGIYTVTTAGDGSTAFVLTRSEDADSTSDLTTGAFVFVETGSANQNKSFVLKANANGTSPVLDTNPLLFIQFSGAGQITTDTGLTKNGDTISLDFSSLTTVANGAFSLASDFLVIVDGGGNEEKLAMSNFLLWATGNGNYGLAPDSSTGYLSIKASNGITVNSSGISAALPKGESGSVGSTLSNDNSQTGITISATPAGDSHVRVTVNGVGVELGDGAKTSCDAYFDDGSNGARSIAAITAGDELIWNGNASGQGSYILESSDLVEIFYNA